MPFRKEPPHRHGDASKTAIVLANLGTPEAPTAAAVRPYLKQFLSDPRVVEIPRVVWWFILNLLILPFRSRKSAEKYALIWSAEGSPLMVHTRKQAALLRGYLGERGHDVQVMPAMRYGEPSLTAVLEQLKEQRCERILVLPAYPQYSATTTASIFDAVFAHYSKTRNVPELRFVKHYHDDENYIVALRESVLNYWEVNGRPDKLMISFHGVPKRTLLLGDPYHCECHKTARLLAAQLGLTDDQFVVTFQSRFGKAEWLQPYTEPTLIQLAKDGVQRVDVVCPGFVSDCLETLEEIGMTARKAFLTAGGKDYHLIPCLNESPIWIRALVQIAEQHMAGWSTVIPAAMQQENNALLADSKARAIALGANQ